MSEQNKCFLLSIAADSKCSGPEDYPNQTGAGHPLDSNVRPHAFRHTVRFTVHNIQDPAGQGSPVTGGIVSVPAQHDLRTSLYVYARMQALGLLKEHQRVGRY
ncbi:MAG: hypothetical protein HQ546_02030 [Planctomycetes bacterium]|nr:hypothetical protein [Planctomycetota bacterium]